MFSLDNIESLVLAEGPSCASVTQLVKRVILRLNLTTEECLEHDHNDTPTNRPTSAEGNQEAQFCICEKFSRPVKLQCQRTLFLFFFLQLMDMDS